MSAPVVLVLAKAPLPGAVKTRLAATEGPRTAARLALAALCDTLAVCEEVFGADRCHLAVSGDLRAVGDPELRTRLTAWTVHPQHGRGLGARITAAHRAVHARTGAPVVQLGMDTPQLAADTLETVAATVARTRRPVLGPAEDGGWWVLASSTPGDVDGLETVPMSTPGTGRATRALLHRRAGAVTGAPSLRDVDDAADAEAVAGLAPGTRFARTWRGRSRA